MRSPCSRPGGLRKRRIGWFLAWPFLFGPALSAQVPPPPPAAQAPAPGRLVVRQASRVVLSHTGIHTHANFLLFATGAYDIGAMQHDPAHYPHLIVRARCALPTDRAALPPDLVALGAGGPPVPNPYGPIDGGHGGPGWTLLPFQKNGQNWVKVLAPTRFANWLALQPPARRKQYLMPRHYTLEATWD